MKRCVEALGQQIRGEWYSDQYDHVTDEEQKDAMLEKRVQVIHLTDDYLFPGTASFGKSRKPDWYMATDGLHLNEKGNEKLAKELVSRLMKEEI